MKIQTSNAEYKRTKYQINFISDNLVNGNDIDTPEIIDAQVVEYIHYT